MAGKSLSAISQRAGSVYMALPEELIQPKEMNARRFQSEAIEGLVDQFLDPSVGQLQPIGVRQTPEGPAVVYGFKRLQAALEINEHKLYKAAKHLNGEPFRIACISVQPTGVEREQVDESMFIRSIMENLSRKSTSPIDDAYNIDRLIVEFGKSRKEIAKLYGRTDSWISKTLSLLKLDVTDQKRVHSGELSWGAAVELAASLSDVDEGTAQAIHQAVDEAEKEKGKGLTRDEVSSVTREAGSRHRGKGEGAHLPPVMTSDQVQAADQKGEQYQEEKPGHGKKKGRGRPRKETVARTLKQVRVFFTELAEYEDSEIDPDETTAQLGKQFLKYLDGGYTNKGMRRILLKYGGLVE